MLQAVPADVIPLGVYNPRLISAIARTFADKVENGVFGEVVRAVVLLETDEGPIRMYWGEEISHLEAVGLIHLALHGACSEAVIEMADEADG